MKKEPAVPLITPLVNPSQPPRAWFGVQVGTPKRPGDGLISPLAAFPLRPGILPTAGSAPPGEHDTCS